MISKKEKETGKAGLFAKLDPAMQQALVSARKDFEDAGSIRRFFGRYEKKLHELEERAKARGLRGRQWKSLYQETRKLVAEAANLHRKVREREHAALSAFGRTVRRIREESETGAGPVPPETVELLARAVKLRTVEQEWLDGALQHAHMIANLPANATPVELITLLEQRRQYMERAGSVCREADALLRQALGAVPASVPARAAAVPAAAGEGPSPVPGDPAPVDPGELRDEEWERWLSRAAREEEEEQGEEPARDDARKEEVVKKIEVAAKEKGGDGAGRPGGAAPEPDSWEEECRRTLAEPFEDLDRKVEDLAGFVQAALDRASELTAARIQRLEDDHDRMLSREVRNRQQVERRAEELKAALEKAEKELAEARSAHEALKADLEKRIAELTRGSEELRKDLEAEKKTAAALREDLAKERKRIEEERKKLEADRKVLEEETAVARKERDESLLLIASLSRRLGTPGFEKVPVPDPEEIRKKK